MKRILSTVLLTLAVLMPTALWAQGIAGDSTAVAAPTFRFEGDFLYIETATEGASIFYRMEELPNMDEATIDKISSNMTVTADGQQSIYYHQPIEITKSVIIKAIAADATVSEVSTLVYDYDAWQKLLEALDYGMDVSGRASDNSNVPDDMKEQLTHMLEEGKWVYYERMWDRNAVYNLTNEIMQLAHQIDEMMNTVNVSEAYVVLSEDGKGSTLTFYYDDQKENREGWMPMGQDGKNITWTNYAQGITNVIFDESFANCTTLTSTASWFSGFNNLVNIEGIEYLKTDNVTDMSAMFWGCAKLTTIYVASEWSTAKVEYGDNMFTGCTKLVGGAGTVYDADHVDYSYAHIDGGPTNPGYFTDKNALVVSDDIIQFADANVKAICVENWDTDGDGELSMSEVAVVTSLGVIFKNNSTINSFDEFQYFTGVTSIDDDAFRYCSHLNSIKFPTNLNTIGSNAFYGCPLSSIEFPESLNTIGDYAFISTNITSVFITQGVVSLGINPFEYCSYLESIVVDEQNPVYDSRNQCNAIIESSSNKLVVGCKKAVIPEGIVTIGENAFVSCKFDSHPSFPSTLKNIEKRAFENCTGFTHLVLTDGIEYLGYYAFTTCGIEELTLPSTLKEIIGGCFNHNNLHSIRIPASVNYIADGAFSSNSELEEIVVEEGNQVYSSNNCNVIFNTSTGLLVQASNNFVFPDGVKSLGWHSFDGLAHVTKVDIPEGVTDLGDYTFYPCRALEELTIPSTISGDGIHDLTFYDCTGLKVIRCYIKSPSPLSSKYSAGPFGCNSQDAEMTYKQAILYVPYGTKALYESTDGWNKFLNIVEMEPAVDYSFDYNGVLWVDSDVTMAQVMEEASKNHNVAEQITAIVWNSSKPLTNSDLQEFDNPNMLIYVASDSLAPQNRDNVVVGNYAKNIVLKDVESGNGNFYCPREFMAEMISYTRNFQQKTEVGVSRGWETIALPFDVQTITHEKYGTISPFGWNDGNKHFWLRQLTYQGLEQATAIQANWPYLISMPNSETYTSSYNLAGRVTFSAQNVVVPETEEYGVDMYSEEGGMVMMHATFSGVSKSAGVYALNVGEARGNNPEGSVFEVNYRDIRPFEAYTIHEGNGPAPQFIPVAGFTDGGTTGIEDVRGLMSDGRGNQWYDLNGRKLQQKPKQKGFYIQNGRKMVVK